MVHRVRRELHSLGRRPPASRERNGRPLACRNPVLSSVDPMAQPPPPRSRQDVSRAEPHRIQQPRLLRVFLVCLLAIGALFLVYELVERTWLRDAEPEVIRALHLIRGFSAAIIATVFVVVLVLRQTYGAQDTLLPASPRSWLHPSDSESSRILCTLGN